MSRELQKHDWDPLVLSIVQGDCILMLGPDAVTDEANGSRQPILDLFATHLISKLPPDLAESLDGATFAEAAQVYRSKSGAGAYDLRNEANTFFAVKKDAVDPVLSNLATLPFKLVINTTPGLQMEHALRSNKKEFETAHYRVNGGKVDMAPAYSMERPLVYHLYGVISDPKSLVLTVNDLLDFLVAVVSGSPALPNNISSAFKESSNCFLFLGFGFKHWYLRILLHVLYKARAENRSFALERFDETLGRATIQTTKLFFQEGHKIDFFDMDLIQFSTELRTRVEDRLKDQEREGERVQAVVETRPPTVFICHASEDRAHARDLFNKLEERGLRPWIDTERLAGGTEWDPEIRKVIHEIDYVVIIQSRALAGKTEGYVNREINIALDRQQEFRRSVKFVLPVQIDESQLDDIKHLQAIDLTEPQGFEKLVTTIKRDHQLRLKGST